MKIGSNVNPPDCWWECKLVELVLKIVGYCEVENEFFSMTQSFHATIYTIQNVLNGIHNSPKLEIPQMSITSAVDKLYIIKWNPIHP